MLSSEIDHVVSALNVNQDKIKSKGIKSIRSRVANISEFLTEQLSIEDFKQKILEHIFGGMDKVERYEWTEEDWKKIMEISESRYQQWDWNYGKSPKFNVQHSQRFEGVGQIDVRLDVAKGQIENCKIFGDFFGVGSVEEIEQKLNGVRFSKAEIEKALDDVNIKHYFGNLTKEEFVKLLY